MSNQFHAVYSADGALSVRLEAAEVEQPSGKRYLHHRLVVGEGRPGVVIAAQSPKGLLFVRSSRVATGEVIWELPRGSSELQDTQDEDSHSETTLINAASRELLEESGYTAHHAKVIGQYFTDTTVFPQHVGVVVCKVDAASRHDKTDGEVDAVRWISAREVNSMLKNGQLCDAHTLSALALLSTVTQPLE